MTDGLRYLLNVTIEGDIPFAQAAWFVEQHEKLMRFALARQYPSIAAADVEFDALLEWHGDHAVLRGELVPRAIALPGVAA